MREHLSSSFLIYSLYVHVYFDTCTGKYVLQVEYVRTYLRTCIYMYIHAVRDNVRKYAQKTVYNRYNRQNYSRSAKKEIITLHVCLTRWRTRMHMCDGIRNMCDVTYTVLEMCVRLRRAYLCPERVLMQRNHFAVITVAPFISWVMIPLEEESLCLWEFYTNRQFYRVWTLLFWCCKIWYENNSMKKWNLAYENNVKSRIII